MVETVDYTIKVPKEFKEVVDLLAAVTKHFRGGGNLAQAATLLDEFSKAASGIAGVLDEMKSQYKDEAALYLAHQIWVALEKAPAEDVA